MRARELLDRGDIRTVRPALEVVARPGSSRADLPILDQRLHLEELQSLRLALSTRQRARDVPQDCAGVIRQLGLELGEARRRAVPGTSRRAYALGLGRRRLAGCD